MVSELDIEVQAIVTTVGGVPSGGTTNSETPVISGHADPYATVNVYTSATLLGSVTANGQGNWSLQPAEPLFNGVHNLSATQVATNGVRSTTSYFAITVEASDTPPVAYDDSRSLTAPLHFMGGENGGVPSFPVNQFHSKSSPAESNASSGKTAHHGLAELINDPQSFAMQKSGHSDDKGFDMLAFLGDHQTLDFTSLTTKLAEQTTGIGGFDLGGHHNALKLTLADVLTLGNDSLFLDDGKRQVMVNGKEGDSVDLSNSHVAGLSEGDWQHNGTAHVDGVLYNVIEHSSAHTELLVEQAVRIEVH